MKLKLILTTTLLASTLLTTMAPQAGRSKGTVAGGSRGRPSQRQ
jgi:hypothetical protein